MIPDRAASTTCCSRRSCCRWPCGCSGGCSRARSPTERPAATDDGDASTWTGCGRRRPASGVRPSTKGRLRLGVIQVLVLALFLTLFGRLWYLQVFSGDDYQAKAADQSVREIVVQPARGLIVDDMGRPLVANRTSWVVTVDRTLLQQDGPTGPEAAAAAASPARSTGPTTRSGRAPCSAASPGPMAGRLLERLALPAGPGRQGHRRSRPRC